MARLALVIFKALAPVPSCQVEVAAGDVLLALVGAHSRQGSVALVSGECQLIDVQRHVSYIRLGREFARLDIQCIWSWVLNNFIVTLDLRLDPALSIIFNCLQLVNKLQTQLPLVAEASVCDAFLVQRVRWLYPGFVWLLQLED